MDWSFLKFGVKFMYLVQNITVVILLQITELLMEPVFICQCNEHRVCFVVMYFITPASAFSAFAWSLRQGDIFMEICKGCEGNPNPKPPENTGANKNAGDNNEKDCCKKCIKSHCCRTTCRLLLSFCKTLYPAFCWVVILLIDGKYVACALYSKCNSTMTIVDTKDLEMVHGMMRSKISGLSLIALFVVLYFTYLCLRLRQSPEDRYTEMYISRLEKNKEEFAKKYAKTCSERRAESCEKQLKETQSQPGAGNRTSPGAAGGEGLELLERAESQPGAAGGESLQLPGRPESQPGAADGESLQLLERAESQPGAAGGGELNELDPKTIVNIIEEIFLIKN